MSAQMHTDTLRESALKVDSGRKIPCRTWESNLRQRCRAGPMLYQRSYIPTHCSPFLSSRLSLSPVVLVMHSRSLHSPIKFMCVCQKNKQTKNSKPSALL